MKKITAIVFSMILCIISMVSLTSFAENETSPVEISVSSEKDSYKKGEKLTFDVSVKNKNDYEIDNVKLSAAISDGYKITGNQNNTLKLSASEEKTYKITAEEAVKGTDSPKTGVSYPIVYIALLVLTVVLAFKTKNGKKICSFLIAAVLLASYTPKQLGLTAVAEEYVKTTADASFKYNNKDGKLTISAEIPKDDTVTINRSVFEGPSPSGMYTLNTELTSLGGSLKNSESTKSLTYEIKDVNGNIVKSGDINIAADWTINDFGVVPGINTITVKAADKNGKVHSDTVYLDNYCLANMNRTNVDLNDDDSDGICNYYEGILGSDPKSADTDKDGINDYDELFKLHYDPSLPDTDKDGINDDADDLDGDKLSNKDELAAGTDPAKADTDDDGLNDYDEINTYKTDPLKADTDEDGLSDYDDVKLGFSPLSKDTDGNGVLDPDEKKDQVLEKEFDASEGRGIKKVSVSMNLNGNIEKNVSVTNTYDFDSMSRGVVGLVGIPVEIKSQSEFENATITFSYDESALDGVKEENLAVLWYDKENDWYQILDREGESIVDTENNTVSYTTTHFSTYMLVDREGWFEAWRENIDYRVSKTGDTEINCFDIAFVVDVSGSMKGQRIESAKAAMNEFLNAMQYEDAGALITFNGSASIAQSFTTDTGKIRSSVNAMKASGGTNVNSGLLKALTAFEGRSGENKKIVVLICDGDVNYVQTTIDQFKSKDIQIYAINVQSQTAHTNLQKMADETGGQYYYSASSSEMLHKFIEVKNVTLDVIDPTDSDGDGLYDVYETAGMKMPNGQVVNTDPHNKYTDSDGLTDFEETGIVFNVDDRYIGNFTSKEVKYFRMHSDPTSNDTDFDNIADDTDANPWEANEVVLEVGKNHGNQYLNIDDITGNFTDAGDQDWWASHTSNTDLNVWTYATDINSRIWHLGCGVIAMTDLEIYLAQKNNYKFTYPGLSVAFNDITGRPSYDSSTGKMTNSEYMDYVEYNSLNKYTLVAPAQYLTGVYPWEMESGISSFMIKNFDPNFNATWAPFLLQGAAAEKVDVAERMEEMISKNISVPFAYYTSDSSKKLPLYDTAEAAKNKDLTGSNHSVSSHYMTVIGLNKYLKADGTGYDYVMKITSWGHIYYVNYDEYSSNFSYFSHILSIGTLF